MYTRLKSILYKY